MNNSAFSIKQAVLSWIALTFALWGTSSLGLVTKDGKYLDFQNLEGTDTLINVNSSMELGTIGEPPPGWGGRCFISKALSVKLAGLRFGPITVAGGNPGKCMMLQFPEGVLRIFLSTPRFYLKKGSSLTVSLDVKAVANDDGTKQPLSDYDCTLGFRGEPDKVTTFKVQENYQTFHPTFSWNTFTFKFTPSGSDNFYEVMLICGKPKVKLLVDNFQLTEGNTSAAGPQEEAAVLTNKLVPNYSPGDKIALCIRALLNSDKSNEPVTVQLTSDTDGSLISKVVVMLHKKSEGDASHLEPPLFEGSLEIPAERFGAFTTTLQHNGAGIKSCGGNFCVVHPSFDYKQFTYGWGIGADSGLYMQAGQNDLPPCAMFPFVSADDYFTACRTAGIRIFRHWETWGNVEPEQGKFVENCTANDITLLKSKGADVIFTLGGDLMYSKFPPYLKDKYTVIRKAFGRDFINVIPPMDIYARHLHFLLDHYGKDIWMWEVLNEQQILPQEYLGYLKYSYKTIKAQYPHSLVLGNGVSTDVGHIVENYLKTLTDADPKWQSYLDINVFHPYYSTSDYLNDEYFRYSNLVSTIRRYTDPAKPLWDNEAFYLVPPGQRQIQDDVNQQIYGAAELQRHILESHLLKIPVVTSLGPLSIFKSTYLQDAIPNEVSVGGNALSFMLKDMETLEKIDLNNYVRCGVYSDASRQNGLGFIFDLRPQGSLLQAPANGSNSGPSLTSGTKVQFFDLFGNPIEWKGSLKLSYEPYYLKGRPDDLKTFLSNAKLTTTASLTARQFNNDLIVEGIKLGGSGVDKIRLQSPLLQSSSNDITLDFSASEQINVRLKNVLAAPLESGAEVPWNEAQTFSGTMKILPANKVYSLPSGNIDLPQGTMVRVWIDGGNLNVKADVKVKGGYFTVVSAKDSHLWEGDSMELFIDPEPFNNLGRNTTSRMNIFQYAFAAKPSATGQTIYAKNYLTGDLNASRAKCEVTGNSDGYSLSASIPMHEINPKDTIIGLDIQLNHVGGIGWKGRESLGPKPGQDQLFRLHYPLFDIEADK